MEHNAVCYTIFYLKINQNNIEGIASVSAVEADYYTTIILRARACPLALNQLSL